MKEYLDMWKNYANFSGRTSIRGYWMAFLFTFIASTILSIIAKVIPVLSILSSIHALAIVVPSLAIAIRRFRDGGKKWTCVLLPLIPLVGWIIYIVKLCAPSVTESVEAV